MRASLLGVHLYESELIPDALNEIVQARFGSNHQRRQPSHKLPDVLQTKFAANDDCMILSCEFVHLLEADGVNLVVDIYIRRHEWVLVFPRRKCLHRHGRYLRVPAFHGSISAHSWTQLARVTLPIRTSMNSSVVI